MDNEYQHREFHKDTTPLSGLPGSIWYYFDQRVQ